MNRPIVHLCRRFPLVAALCALALAASARAHDERAAGGAQALTVAFEQKLNQPLPLDTRFRDEQGRLVSLSQYFTGRPVILAPVYYDCARLCPLVLDGLVRSLRAVPFSVGADLTVVAFSIDPREAPALARAKKQTAVQRYGSGSGRGWHFLTGERASIERLARAIGFAYREEPARQQYAHATGIVVTTADGRVSRYLYGFDFAPRDLKLALVEAGQGKIGSPIDQLLLLCYEYDPATGKYGLVILNSLRLSGIATVAALAAFVACMLRRERQKNRARAGGA
ncbi:MAG TPA: SCO family protein [Candidatus Acidoferrales bacterium]|nr:SCO family protein [Candidatus Acidoferrales bacterium]